MKQKDPAPWILVVCAAQLLFYLYSAYLGDDTRYGFNQLRHVDPFAAAGLITAFLGVLLLVRRRNWALPAQQPVPRSRVLAGSLLVTTVALLLFTTLGNGFVNDDGLENSFCLSNGTFRVRFDEMLSGISVQSIWNTFGDPALFTPFDAYAAFSSAMGGVFILFAMLLSNRESGTRWPFFLLLMVTGGFMQVFFGDVEHYAGITAFSMAYIWAVREFLEDRFTILIPALFLAVAVSMHVMALCFLPAHLLLCIRAWRRKPRSLVPVSMALMVTVLLLVFVIAASMGMDYRNLENSHLFGSGDGRTTVDMLATPSISYYNAVTSVLFLLFPFWWVPLILLFTGNIGNDAFNRFLITATAGLLLMAYVWRLGLRPYFDWNLLAAVAVPPSVLAWRNLMRTRPTRLQLPAMLLLAFTGLFHSCSWIMANHDCCSTPRMEVINRIATESRMPICLIPEEFREPGLPGVPANSATP